MKTKNEIGSNQNNVSDKLTGSKAQVSEVIKDVEIGLCDFPYKGSDFRRCFVGRDSWWPLFFDLMQPSVER